MMQVWGFLLLIAGLLWIGESIAVWFGYEPSDFSIFVAFLITGCTMIKWAYEAFTGKK